MGLVGVPMSAYSHGMRLCEFPIGAEPPGDNPGFLAINPYLLAKLFKYGLRKKGPALLARGHTGDNPAANKALNSEARPLTSGLLARTA